MICYLILSHRQPAQVARLVRALVDGSPRATVLVHHDQGASRLERGDLGDSDRVHLLGFRRGMRWGRWDLVDVVLRSLAWARDHLDVAWFVLLSGQDYPIARPAEIDAVLEDCRFDAFVHGEIVEQRPEIGLPLAPGGWTTRRYFYRYRSAPGVRVDPAQPVGRTLQRAASVVTGVQPWIAVWPFPDGSVQIGVRARATPFSEELRCFKGSQWFAASRRAVDVLLARASSDDVLVRHYRRCVIPDESFIHTVLLNAPSLRVCNDDLRFVRWADGASHPEVLTAEDVEPALASGRLFARKFDLDADRRALDEIDRRLDLLSRDR